MRPSSLRPLVLVLAPVLAFCGAAALGVPAFRTTLPPAAAQDGTELRKDPGYAFYDDRARKILKSAGAKVWDAAKVAKGWGLHQLAYEQAERALAFDPDLEDARDHLGYVKKAGKWELDQDKATHVPKQNQKSEKESDESLQKKIDKWTQESLRKADEFVAAKYAELGDECAAKGFPEQAKKGYESSLRLDKDNAKARKGLGYKRLGKVWLTDKQEQARKDAANAVVVKEPSSWDDFYKTKLNKVETAHFRVESPYSVEEITQYAQTAETLYCFYLADFGMDPTQDVFSGGKMEFLVLQNDDQWNKFIDAHGGDDKEFSRKLGGSSYGTFGRAVRSGEGSTPVSRQDMILHTSVHVLNQVVWKANRQAWLDEGLAYYYTLKVIDNTLTHCVAQKKTGDYGNQGGGRVEGGIKTWDDAANWKPKVREMVERKADIELRKLVVTPIHTLQFEDSVKSWCIVTWFMDKDRDKFIDLLKLVGGGQNGENALQGVYEKGLEELDTEWRKYALKTY